MLCSGSFVGGTRRTHLPLPHVVFLQHSLGTPPSTKLLQDQHLSVPLLLPELLDLFVCFLLLSNYADVYDSTAVVWEGKR